jgi:hypothetical protein
LTPKQNWHSHTLDKLSPVYEQVRIHHLVTTNPLGHITLKSPL